MMSARAGWRDDIPLSFFEQLDGVFCNCTSILSKTGVELRLSAAGLIGGEVHVTAEALENLHDGFTSLREERIGQAGDEQLDGVHGQIIRPTKIP